MQIVRLVVNDQVAFKRDVRQLGRVIPHLSEIRLRVPNKTAPRAFVFRGRGRREFLLGRRVGSDARTSACGAILRYAAPPCV
jgi:hypothetical protein